jgi:hypothetical protein
MKTTNNGHHPKFITIPITYITITLLIQFLIHNQNTKHNFLIHNHCSIILHIKGLSKIVNIDHNTTTRRPTKITHKIS